MRSFFYAVAALVISLCVFCPRLLIFYRGLTEGTEVVSGTFEWARGLTFQRQCDSPFTPPDEPAMRWRLLPAVVCHYSGLTGNRAFIFPYLGVLALCVASASLFRTAIPNERDAFVATAIVAMSSAAVVSTAWLGISDAWYATALLGLTHWANPFALATCALLGGWIDERFLIAFPIVFFARRLYRRSNGVADDSLKFLAITLPLLAAYVGIRLIGSRTDDTSQGFVRTVVSQAHVWIPWVPMGLWMGWRSCWCVGADVARAMATTASKLESALAVAATLVSMGVITLLAADTTRNATLLLPWMSTGLILASRVPGRLVRLGVASILIPMGNVTYTKFALSSPLPLEAVRLILRRE